VTAASGVIADGPESAPSGAGFLAGIEPEITRDLFAAVKMSYWTDAQNKTQRHDRTNSTDFTWRKENSELQGPLSFVNGESSMLTRSVMRQNHLDLGSCRTCSAPY
jgi:hypothetical protein